ncbi:MAG: 3-hydroxyacyl-CoA dehydrogenase NAD-binding domain-containing protein, partial [Bauldia litoralis]|uniref:3-hydroxyacyl-CoA dehydrogenase NAD-binding domain-containing protein n=1 Tax=Bauldia litoralis TaxID=665467 RepID=UPI0032993ACA
MKVRKVGVIGAGQMGNGIAHVCALAGYEVALNDMTEERIEAGLATINGNMTRQASSGRISEADKEAALDRISAAPSYEAFEDADVVI